MLAVTVEPAFAHRSDGALSEQHAVLGDAAEQAILDGLLAAAVHLEADPAGAVEVAMLEARVAEAHPGGGLVGNAAANSHVAHDHVLHTVQDKPDGCTLENRARTEADQR